MTRKIRLPGIVALLITICLAAAAFSPVAMAAKAEEKTEEAQNV